MFFAVAIVVIINKTKRCVELSNIGAIWTVGQILKSPDLMYQHKFALLIVVEILENEASPPFPSQIGQSFRKSDEIRRAGDGRKSIPA